MPPLNGPISLGLHRDTRRTRYHLYLSDDGLCETWEESGFREGEPGYTLDMVCEYLTGEQAVGRYGASKVVSALSQVDGILADRALRMSRSAAILDAKQISALSPQAHPRR